MGELIQKRGRDFRKFFPEFDGLTIESQVDGQLDVNFCKYEDIEFNQTVSFRKPPLYKTLLFFSVLLNVGLLMAFIAPWLKQITNSPFILLVPAILPIPFLIFWGRHVFKSQSEKILSGSKQIVFFYDKKHTVLADSFIERLKKNQREYMRKKYMRIDELVPPDQQERIFAWLYKRGFISRSEFEILTEETSRLRISKKD